MSETSIISVANLQDVEISIDKNILDLKFELLGVAGKVEAVDSFESQEFASEALRKISGLLKSIEDARKTVKAPALAIGKKIDDIAKNFVGELEDEKARLSKAIGSYVAAEEAKRKEAERKAREEAEAAQRAAQQAAAALNPQAPAPTVVVPVAVVAAPRKVAGTRTFTVRKFEIVDLGELHRLHPELFVPDESKIREFAKGLKDISEPVDGLKVWDETKASAL
jgi:hypothetical protein